MSPRRTKWWHQPLNFSFHVLAGAGIFGIIALAAVGLALLTAWLETLTYNGQPVVGKLIVWGLRSGEYALFATDLILFLIFLIRTTMKSFKEL